ncbi:2-iminobutanoate/2-iminopropanoate deaminase [Actinopolymorpha cephalotaxi]|uniref:2-iminobutanoate/2-iminopropanoate deaminase n=1 Tax=Actinopolymorpha cephalotaxi TaxID=504797 RepID=A0A1I2KUZ5_9ACTN|nr:Rid family detoxifying hydrolase [Actinopolymorpha cephalotaxi]NYH84697.1 reactive intermediate/imine deaminase [Actinopolymorpha cephalotaxi]SFF70912.1 2-iminobutanoate/2-iminopropanoate deaminase [Actinopolymorpha cephalotaxi]
MAKEAIRTDQAPNPAGAYSQGIVANGFLYTAGFGPADPKTGELVEGGVAEQTAQVMRNVAAVLAERGLTFDDVVKATVHLADLADFADFNRVYESFLEAPYPVRTTVGSQLNNILVEIDVVAALRS